MPRRHEGQRKRRGVDEINVVGNRHQILYRHADKFSVTTLMIAVAEHFVLRTLVVNASQARRTAPAADHCLQHHPPTDRDVTPGSGDDLAGDVAARNMRHRNFDARQTAPRPKIEVVQGAGAHPHQHFARSRLGIGRVLVTQYFDAAVLVKTNGLHSLIWSSGHLVI